MSFGLGAVMVTLFSMYLSTERGELLEQMLVGIAIGVLSLLFIRNRPTPGLGAGQGRYVRRQSLAELSSPVRSGWHWSSTPHLRRCSVSRAVEHQVAGSIRLLDHGLDHLNSLLGMGPAPIWGCRIAPGA